MAGIVFSNCRIFDGAGPEPAEAMVELVEDGRIKEIYDRLLDNIPIRLLNLRVTAAARREAFDFAVLAPPADASLEKASVASRRVWSEGDWCETAIYDRLQLPVGARVAGPAILKQPDGTVFIDPGLRGEIDSFGNLVMARDNEQGKEP